MSESLYAHRNAGFHNRLLLTVSASALFLSVALAQDANASDADHPVIWIEVGGAFDQMSNGDTDWRPPNLTAPLSNSQPLPFGKSPTVGFDVDLKLSYTPEESDWIYSASIRYGRAHFGPKHSHDQSYKLTGYITSFGSGPGVPKYGLTNYDFANAVQSSHSTHAIVDFAAGKDVGLGIFGRGRSVVSAGIRIAQLNETAQGQLTAFTNAPAKYSPGEVGHKAELIASRSFTGIGPAVSWDASAPLVGSLTGGISLDWGANAAILFGRQKANVALRTKDTRYNPGTNYKSGIPTVLSQSTQPSMRAKEVIVPNVGGFAGLSWHLPNAKISLGYRADFFFGAIDGGLATSQKKTRGFYGPFANVSIGIGG